MVNACLGVLFCFVLLDLFMQTHLRAISSLSGMRGASSQMEIHIAFTKGNVCPTFRQKERGHRVVSMSTISQLSAA